MSSSFESSFSISSITQAFSEGLEITLKYWKRCLFLGIFLVLSSFTIINLDLPSFSKELSNIGLARVSDGDYTAMHFIFAKASMLTASIWTPYLAETGSGYFITYPRILGIWGQGGAREALWAVCFYVLKSSVHILTYLFLFQILLSYKTKKIDIEFEFPSFKKMLLFLKYIIFLPILLISLVAIFIPINLFTFCIGSVLSTPLIIFAQASLLFVLPILFEEKTGFFKSFLGSIFTISRNWISFVCFYILLIAVGSGSYLVTQFHEFPHQEWWMILGILIMCFTAPWAMMTCLCVYDKIFNPDR